MCILAGLGRLSRGQVCCMKCDSSLRQAQSCLGILHCEHVGSVFTGAHGKEAGFRWQSHQSRLRAYADYERLGLLVDCASGVTRCWQQSACVSCWRIILGQDFGLLPK